MRLVVEDIPIHFPNGEEVAGYEIVWLVQLYDPMLAPAAFDVNPSTQSASNQMPGEFHLSAGPTQLPKYDIIASRFYPAGTMLHDHAVRPRDFSSHRVDFDKPNAFSSTHVLGDRHKALVGKGWSLVFNDKRWISADDIDDASSKAKGQAASAPSTRTFAFLISNTFVASKRAGGMRFGGTGIRLMKRAEINGLKDQSQRERQASEEAWRNALLS